MPQSRRLQGGDRDRTATGPKPSAPAAPTGTAQRLFRPPPRAAPPQRRAAKRPHVRPTDTAQRTTTPPSTRAPSPTTPTIRKQPAANLRESAELEPDRV